MLRLKTNVMEFLEGNVKPEYFTLVVKSIVDNPPKAHEVKSYRIGDAQSEFRQTFDLRLDLEDFDEIEPLKPYVWYDRYDWDGNPNGYAIVESDVVDCLDCNQGEGAKILRFDTTHFMYIEELKEENDDVSTE